MNPRKPPGYHRLPGGGTTTSLKRYVREWRKLARPIEKALDGKLTGFDPGLLFLLPGRRNGLSLDIDIALKLSKALDEAGPRKGRPTKRDQLIHELVETAEKLPLDAGDIHNGAARTKDKDDTGDEDVQVLSLVYRLARLAQKPRGEP